MGLKSISSNPFLYKINCYYFFAYVMKYFFCKIKAKFDELSLQNMIFFAK